MNDQDAGGSVGTTLREYFCRRCGSRDVRHDAIVQWDPSTEDWNVLDVLDEAWCEDCQQEDNSNGDPYFGLFSELEEIRACLKGQPTPGGKSRSLCPTLTR